jgi:hypothetical protein
MNRTIAIILLIALGLYCFPVIFGVVAGAFAIVIGIAAAVFAAGLSLLFTLLPYIILAYLIWWLLRDNRQHSKR